MANTIDDLAAAHNLHDTDNANETQVVRNNVSTIPIAKTNRRTEMLSEYTAVSKEYADEQGYPVENRTPSKMRKVVSISRVCCGSAS